MPSKLEYPLLVVDAGNTAVKFALVTRRGMTPHPLRTIPTAELSVAATQRIGAKAKSVFVASVVPAASRILKRAFPAVRFVRPATKLAFVTKVDRKTIGADRLANVAAAQARYGRSVLVASFGTATTFDIVDGRGIHLGGAIAPGWKSFAALASTSTSQLPSIDERVPSRIIGRDTREALCAGTNGGYASLVSQLIVQIKKESEAKNARVIFTGGDAQVVAELTGLKVLTDPLLTLKGTAILAEAGAREGRK